MTSDKRFEELKSTALSRIGLEQLLREAFFLGRSSAFEDMKIREEAIKKTLEDKDATDQSKRPNYY